MITPLSIVLLSLALHLVAFLVWRGVRRRSAPPFGTRRPASAKWHRVFSSPDTSRWRGGGALIDALVVLAFCACIAAVVLLCISDVDLITR